MRATIPISLSRRSRIAMSVEALAREVDALLGALSSPNRFIDKVEEMGALHCEANAIESTDPERAARLRARASLSCRIWVFAIQVQN